MKYGQLIGGLISCPETKEEWTRCEAYAREHLSDPAYELYMDLLDGDDFCEKYDELFEELEEAEMIEEDPWYEYEGDEPWVVYDIVPIWVR